MSFLAGVMITALVLWAALVVLLWSNDQRPLNTFWLKVAFYYLVPWMIGLIVLAGFSTQIADRINLPDSSPFKFVLTAVPMLGTWTTVVIMIFLLNPPGAVAESLLRYRAIYSALVLIILFSALGSYGSAQAVHARIEGLDIARTLAEHRILGLNSSLARATGAAQHMLANIHSPDTLRSDLLTLDDASVEAQATAKALQNDVMTAVNAEGSGAVYSNSVGSSILPSLYGISETEKSTSTFSTTLRDIRVELTGYTADSSPVTLTRLLSITFLLPAQFATTTASVAGQSIASSNIDEMPIVAGIVTLLSILELLPWLLLLLFLFRKKSNQAYQITKDLLRLDPSKRLLMMALGLEGDPKDKKVQSRQAELAVKVQLVQLPRKDVPSPDSDKDLYEIISAVAEQAFSSRSYVLNLTMLSVLLAAGWAYIFYPSSSTGLALLVAQNGGISRFTHYLIDGLSPLTLGFAGSYFYILLLLVRRYLAADLYPAAFLRSSQRIIIVFILCLVISLLPWSGDVSLPWGSIGVLAGPMLGIAFLSGIFPDWALQIIAQRVSTAIGTAGPDVTVAEQLVNLQGVTVWDASRLEEEQIDNIQNMATCEIDKLVLATHFTTDQIVDWIDQALLYIHTSNDVGMYKQLRAVNIRTATELWKATGFNSPHFDKSLADVVKAMNWENKTPTPFTAEGLRALCVLLESAPNINCIVNWQNGAIPLAPPQTSPDSKPAVAPTPGSP